MADTLDFDWGTAKVIGGPQDNADTLSPAISAVLNNNVPQWRADGLNDAQIEQRVRDSVDSIEANAGNAPDFDWSSAKVVGGPPSTLDDQRQAKATGYELPDYSPQVYNSPNKALAEPDAFQARPESWGDYLSNLGSAAQAGARKAAGGMVQQLGELPQAIIEPFTQALGFGEQKPGALAQAGQQEVAKASGEEARARSHLLSAPDENTGALDQAKYYAQEAAIGAPVMAAAIAAGPVGGAALFGGQTAGQAYAQKRQEGEAPLTAATSADLEGAVSAVTSSLTLENTLNPAAIGALRRIADTTGSVAAQNVINEATAIAAEQHIDGKELSDDEISSRLWTAVKSSAVAGPLFGAAGVVAHRLATNPTDESAARVRDLSQQVIDTTPRDALQQGAAIADAAAENADVKPDQPPATAAVADVRPAGESEAGPVVPESATGEPENVNGDQDTRQSTGESPDETQIPETEEAPVAHKTATAIEELPLADLKLSQDVPQFKAGANDSGVVEPLGGEFDRRGTGPIQVWRRNDGSLEVISGRHRLDLARRSGEDTIPAQVYNEADGFDARHAATLDAELNIRDGQGKVKDYVSYFQNNPGLDETEADARGLLARATGRRAYTIARKGDAELIAAHSADRLSDEAAVQIANAAPNSGALQALGMKLVQEGQPIAKAQNAIRAARTMMGPRQTNGDMFGFDDSAIQDAVAMAGVATKKQRDISERLAAITGASKRPELAAKEGIDVRDPHALSERIGQLRAERDSWENWETDPNKVGQIRDELGFSPQTEEVEHEPERDTETANLFSRVETAGTHDDNRDAAKLWRTQGTDSPYFQKWYGESQVKQPNGNPQVVYHGTAEDFSAFDDAKLGNATQHATAPLGHFFTADPKLADRYAENASEGVPANKRVIPAYLSIEKPYTMPLAEAQAIESPEQARQVRQQLQSEGFDGIHIPESKSWIAFGSEQVKSVANRGTFEAGNPDILYHRAYHGSPHDFDQFSSGAIGTGEGHQAYGHGLYFAGKKEVAEHYKDAGVMVSPRLRMILDNHDGNREKTIAALQVAVDGNHNGGKETWGPALEEAKALKPGKLYETELAPKEHEYLDWDKPLSEQSEHVREALAAHDDSFKPENDEYDANEQGQITYNRLASSEYGQEGASKFLHDAGIRGIRYADGSSRVNAGDVRMWEQTLATLKERNASDAAIKNAERELAAAKEKVNHNYVIFSDKDVSIINKYKKGAQDTGLSSDEARTVLTKEFGPIAMRKMERNGLSLLSGADLAPHTPELSEAQRSGVKGFSRAGRATVIHDQVSADELPNTVVHEVWHANADKVLPAEKQNELARAVEKIGKRSPEVQAALDRIPKDTPAKNRNAEIVAQTLGDLYKQPIGRRAMDAIKLGLNRLGLPLDWLSAHEAALREIGIQNLKHFTESEPSYQTAAAKSRVRVPVDRVPVNRVSQTDEETRPPVSASSLPRQTAADTQTSATPQGVSVAASDQSPAKDTTGIKNAQVNAEREARGVTPLESEARQAFGESWERAQAKAAADPDYGRRLTAELLDRPRAVTQDEAAALLHDRVRIHNEYNAAIEETSKTEGKTDADQAADLYRLKAAEQQMDDNDLADRRAGSESGRSLNARRMMANLDYSLARMMQRARIAEGGELPEAVKNRITGMATRIADLTKQLEAQQASRGGARKGGAGKDVAAEFDALKAELARISRKPETKAEPAQYARAEPAVAAIIRRMAENRARAGLDGDEVVRQIHDAVKDHADVSERDVRDAISGYGKERKPTKDELSLRFNALKAELRELSRSEDIAAGRAVSPKDKARQTQIQKDLAETRRKILAGDFSKPERKSPLYNDQTLELQRQLNIARRQYEQLLRRREERNQTFAWKTFDLIHNIHLMDILSSAHVYPKLAAAVITRSVTSPAQGLVVSAARMIPGIRKWADLAPRHGQGFVPGAEWAAIKGFKEGAKGFGQQIVHGQSKLDATFGGKDHVTAEYTDFVGSHFIDAIKTGDYREAIKTATSIPGRTHAAVKEFAVQPEFYRSMFLRDRQMRENLVKSGMEPAKVDEFMSRETTKAQLGAQAYVDSVESKNQERIKVADSINGLITSLDRGGLGEQALSFALKTIFPIRKIGISIAKELTSYTAGGIKALTRMRGDFNEENAEYIMKNIAKQGVGAALFAIGYLAGPAMLGGIPMAGDKKRRPDVKPGEASVGGVSIGTEGFHGAAAQMLQLGSGYRRLYEAHYGKSHEAISAGLQSFGENAGSLMIRTIPYTDQVRRMVNTAEYGRGASEIAGDQLRSVFVPQIVQQEAAREDPFKGYRKPGSIVEDVKLGIPGLREQVPTHAHKAH